MSDPTESRAREPMSQKLARLGLKSGPASPKVFRSARRRRDLDENIFSKLPAAIDKTNKTK